VEISATEFRQNLYRLLDQVAEGRGEVLINRKGKKIRLVVEGSKKRSDRLIPHDTLIGDPRDLLDPDFFKTPWEWKEERNLEGLS